MPKPDYDVAVRSSDRGRSGSSPGAVCGCALAGLLPVVLVCGCASSTPGGFGLRAGAFLPGRGQTTDYQADYLVGAYYGREILSIQGWSWEAGLDFTSPEADDGSEVVDLVLIRADLSATFHEWAGSGAGLYLHWGVQCSFRVSPGSGTDFMLAAGAGLRSGGKRWDLRLTGQSVLGDANVDQIWVVTGGYCF